jgi:hypothetical protein
VRHANNLSERSARGAQLMERHELLACRIVVLGCLLGLAATVYLLFGLAGYVHNPFLNWSIAAALLVSAAFFLARFFALPAGTNWIGGLIWTAILLFLIVEFALALLPPVSRDELTHHLAIPKLYARAGRIIEVPMAPYSYYPMLLDMLYTPWVYWGYDFVPKLIDCLYAYLTGLLLYDYLSKRMNEIYGLLGFFLFVSTPAIARLSHWAYVDLGLTFYVTAALLSLLQWRDERKLLWLGLAALSLGFALATKPNAMVAALLLGFLFLLAIVRPPRQTPAHCSIELVIFGTGVLLPFAPWLLKNWMQTGNPFYPLLGSLFSSRPGDLPQGASFGEIGIFLKRELLYGESLWQIVALPLRIFLFGADDNPRLFDGVLTVVLIAFLPWAFKGKWLEDKKLLAGFAVLFLLYAVFLVDLRIRYVLPIVPALAALAAYGIFNIYLRIKRPVYLFALLIAAGLWHAAYLFEYAREAAPLAYLTGRQSRDSYLAHALPDYPALQFINRHTPPSAKIYLLFTGRRAYYCEREYFHDGGELPGYLVAIIRAAKTSDDIARELTGNRITHFIVRENLLTEFLTHNLSAGQASLWNEFAGRRLVLQFRDRGHSVYQIDG